MIASRTHTASDSLLVSAYSNYEKELTRYAFSKTHNHALCQDLVQEVFAKTWRYLLRQKKIAAMRPFLFRVINNLIVDEYRKRKVISLDFLLEKHFEPSIDPTSQLMDSIDGTQALLLFKQLPTLYRRILELRYVEGLSVAEIAQQTGQSANATSVQLHRGLMKLKQLYYRTSKPSRQEINQSSTRHYLDGEQAFS